MNTIHLTQTPKKYTKPDFDYEAAFKEGWTISDCGTYANGDPHKELQKLDNPQNGHAFKEDRDAWTHVVARARKGSVLHIQALDLIDRRERLAIETHCGTW